MDSFSNKDIASEYLALKAANDNLRERGKQWLWERFDLLCAEANRKLMLHDNQSQVQIGHQEWRFKVGSSMMVGERLGVRHNSKTLTIEVGWPREPVHGFVPDGGLARARIGLSQNTMLEARVIAELILKPQGQNDPAWRLISNGKLGEQVTESHLRAYLKMILVDPED